MRSLKYKFIILLSMGLVGMLMVPTIAAAGPYTQLQVLLPGETPAPGTPSGKTGVPLSQTVGESFTFRVRAVDDQWNLVTSITDVISFESSDAVATLPPNTSLVGGESSLSATFNAAGSFTISADDQTDPTIPVGTSSAAQVQVLQGFVFQNITQKHTDAGVPFGTSISAVDPGGNPVTGFNGTVRLQELTSFGVGRIEPETVTLSNGFWSGNVTVYRADETNISSGNVNMYVFLDIDPAKNGTSNPFVVHPGPLARVQIVVPGQDPLPGSASGVTGTPATQSAIQDFTVDIFATDNWWNPLPSADNIRITSSDAAASTPVTSTLTDGHVAVNLHLATFGAQTLTVEDMSNGSVQGMTSDPIQVIPAGAHHFEVDAIAGPVTAGDPAMVTIRATDAGGNTLPDFDGNAILAANTGPGSISPEALTFSSGVWTGEITFRGAGNAVQFTCSDYATPPHLGTSNSFVVNPAAYTGMQVLLPGQDPRGGTEIGYTGNPDVQAAGTGFEIRVRAVDQYFNRVPGIGSMFALTSTDENMLFPAGLALTNGEALVTVTLYRSGMQTISAADSDSAGIEPATSSEVEVTAGTYTNMLILAPGEELSPGAENGRSGTPTDQSINYAFTVTVYATDTWFNPVGGVTDMVTITSGDPMAELPADGPMVDGIADFSIRLSTGGFQQITASNVTQPAMVPSTTEVKMISSGFHLEAEITPTTVRAGDTFDLTVKVTNDAGSVIQEINSSVTVEVQNASTQDPGLGTLANTSFQLLQGQRTIAETYTYAENIILVITDDGGNLPARTEVLTVVPGAPTALLLSSNPTWVKGNKTAQVTARVEDDYHNGVPAQTVEFTLLTSLGVLTPVGEPTDSNGETMAEYLSPREPGIDTVLAVSGALSDTLYIETALVDPDAPDGSLTNYPNPFHPDETPTTISYKLKDNASVRMRIYTLSGGLVLDTQFASGDEGGRAGDNFVTWDGRNGNNENVASGGYILFIEAEGNGATMHVMRRKIGVVW
ncbi:MAG: hypothetical protein ABFS42_08055 [Candidatus Krumholzibacteriota bacterium]